MRENYPNAWTAREDKIVMSCREPKRAFRMLKGTRTLPAIRVRRYKLSHPLRAGAPGVKSWTQDELKILRERYPTAASTTELLPLLPRFNEEHIRNKASQLKIKRRFVGDANVPLEGQKELVDQIRLRAVEDGFGLSKLDDMLGTGWYFRDWRRRKTNFVAIAKAMEFFGGTLVIDWRDR